MREDPVCLFPPNLLGAYRIDAYIIHILYLAPLEVTIVLIL